MKQSAFSVNLHELEDGPKELSGALPREWVNKLLKDTDVQLAGDEDGRLDLTLTKTGVEVLVQGRLDVTVSLPCARTLDPAIYRLRPEVFLMLAPAAASATTSKRKRPPRDRNPADAKKSAKKGGWEQDQVLSEEEAASDTYSGELIVLDDFIREFILLELPMLPLREDLRDVPFEANPPLPEARDSEGEKSEKPLDPRLSPLQEIKARLEKKE